MPSAAACTNLPVTEKLAAGLLTGAPKQLAIKHVEGCSICTGHLATLPLDEGLLHIVRRAETLATPVAGPTPQDGGPAQVSTFHGGLALPQPTVTCPGCGKKLKLKGNRAGKALRCPFCKNPIELQDVPVTLAKGQAPTPAPPATQATRPVVPDRSAQETIAANVPSNASELCSFLAPPQLPDELGRLGPFRILEVIGSGGMGVVFRADDPNLHRQVAVKAMLPGLADNPLSKDRFFREARAAAAVQHDHVVVIHQVDEDLGVPFLAMEFLHGESLDTRLRRERKLPRKEAMRIARETAEGLAAAHDRGLIHRDIKPGNIWLEGERGRVKILDFGLARTVAGDSNLTSKGVIMGTPAYMCPEQAAGTVPDARGDLFSLGCVLYAMCAGDVPFQGTDPISTLVAIASQEPEHVRDLDPSLPREFAELIMQLLEKKPEHRPRSAHAVVQRIAELEAGKPPRREEPPSSLREKGPKTKKPAARRALPLGWIVMAAGVVVVLAGATAWGVIALATRGDGDSASTPAATSEKAPVNDRGTVVVESDVESAQIRFSQGGKTVLVVDATPKKEVSLHAGKYEVELVSPKDGLRLPTREFTLTAGEKRSLEVRFEAKAIPLPPKKGPKFKGDFPPPGEGLEKKGPPPEFLKGLKEKKDKLDPGFDPGKGMPEKKGPGPKGPPGGDAAGPPKLGEAVRASDRWM
jgi:hypothetical protein